MPHYLDTSAAVKLVAAEPATDALRRWIHESGAQLVASELVRTELLRAVRRRAPDRLPAARLLLDAVHVAEVTTADLARAGVLDPVELRTLDAVHLAVALSLAPLDAIVTYDDRLAAAARHHGLAVVAPGS